MQRTVRRVLLIAAAFALFVVPAVAIAAAGFTDVADDNVFVADIQWMKDNNITKGCNPPTNDRFCPENNVTREQMSAFMHRLAIAQVVDAATAVEADNADTLDGKDSTDFLGAGSRAVNSDKLDGKDSTDFLGADAKAVDSDKLDGKTAADFVSGAAWVDKVYTFNNWAAGAEKYVRIDCPGFKTPLAGGGLENGGVVSMVDSFPYFASLTDKGWQMAWQNQGSLGIISVSGKIWVLCSDVDLGLVAMSSDTGEADPDQ